MTGVQSIKSFPTKSLVDHGESQGGLLLVPVGAGRVDHSVDGRWRRWHARRRWWSWRHGWWRSSWRWWWTTWRRHVARQRPQPRRREATGVTAPSFASIRRRRSAQLRRSEHGRSSWRCTSDAQYPEHQSAQPGRDPAPGRRLQPRSSEPSRRRPPQRARQSAAVRRWSSGSTPEHQHPEPRESFAATTRCAPRRRAVVYSP
jgi:hypothetical protein